MPLITTSLLWLIRRLTMVPMMTSKYATNTISADTAANLRGQEESTTVQVTQAHPTVPNRTAELIWTSLYKCPKSLHVLWYEHKFGIRGRKPVRMFNGEKEEKPSFNIH